MITHPWDAREGARIVGDRIAANTVKLARALPALAMLTALAGAVLAFVADSMALVFFFAASAFAVLGFEAMLRAVGGDVQSARIRIRDRRQRIDRFRKNAAAARPGEIWTVQHYGTDSHGTDLSMWTVGPVERLNGHGPKQLGETLLPDRYKPLRWFTGVLSSREPYLLRGDVAPAFRDERPDAGGRRFADLPTGTCVFVEHESEWYPGARFVEWGAVSPNYVNRLGEQGRRVGGSWVTVAEVTAVLVDGEDTDATPAVGGREPQPAG